ncbi:unnamed protein product [Moneuplotes crassus]|uniref:Uncharacterized protein n=1 Tax=Euplotes crassus TaxID=5936 RepID=A0AAD2D2U7_EUPCR|nr:unnamed protein product [Moneuplotes crassus]
MFGFLPGFLRVFLEDNEADVAKVLAFSVAISFAHMLGSLSSCELGGTAIGIKRNLISNLKGRIRSYICNFRYEVILF